MPDLDAIIQSSVNAARESFGDDGGEVNTGEADATGDIVPDGDVEGEGEGVGGGEAVAEGGTPGPEGDKPIVEGEVVPPVVPKKLSDAEKALEEAGFKSHRADGKENRIPHSRTVKIIENSHKKLAEQITGTIVPDGTTPFEAITKHVARIPDLESQVRAKDDEIATSNGVMEIMETDAPRFISMLLQVNPEYQKYLRTEGDEGGTGGQVETPVVSKDMPPPDVDLGEGRKTYSTDGLVSLLQWQAIKTRAEVMTEVDKKFKPLTSDYEAQQRINAAIPRLQRQVQHAEQSWKGFKDNKAEIISRLQADKTIPSLHDAYILIMNEKHDAALTAATADEVKLRAKLLAEIKAAPASTSTTPGSKPASVSTGPRSIEDVIRDSVKKLKQGAQ